jgi:hypothetical protein
MKTLRIDARVSAVGFTVHLLAQCEAVADNRGRLTASLAPSAQPPVRSDQSNLPPWNGAWTVIGKGQEIARLAQTFTPDTAAVGRRRHRHHDR